MDKILRLENISRSFNGLKAIDSLSMDIESGKISAVIGPNGAGKTTLFNLICGYLYPDKGRIIYKDRNITVLNPWERSLSGIGRLFQDIRVFKKLTLLENLMITFNDGSENPFKAIFGRKNKNNPPIPPLLKWGKGGFSEKKEGEKNEIAMKWLHFVNLADRKDSLAESISWGQQKLLCIARLLCGDFEFLLIDEPVSGVNPEMAALILEKIKELKGFGKTIIAVEHDMVAVEKISDYIYFMESGKIVASGLPEEILNNQEVMGTYIGI